MPKASCICMILLSRAWNYQFIRERDISYATDKNTKSLWTHFAEWGSVAIYPPGCQYGNIFLRAFSILVAATVVVLSYCRAFAGNCGGWSLPDTHTAGDRAYQPSSGPGSGNRFGNSAFHTRSGCWSHVRCIWIAYVDCGVDAGSSRIGLGFTVVCVDLDGALRCFRSHL